jgi:uncharacterized hydrophobic protein (TIGR00271 family)
MSILALPTSDQEAASLACWGYHFAQAKKSDLVIFHPVSKGLPTTDEPFGFDRPLGDPVLESARKTLSSLIHNLGRQGGKILFKSIDNTDLNQVIKKELSAFNVELLLLAKETKKSRESNINKQVVQYLFDQAPCDLILIRTGKSAEPVCRRILVPVSDGSTSKQTLKLAASLTAAANCEATAMFVQPDIGEESLEVGELTLRTILRNAGADKNNSIRPLTLVSNNLTKSIADVAEENYQLVLIGASNVGALRRFLFGTVADRLLDSDTGLAVGAYKVANPFSYRMFSLLERWLYLKVPQLNREERVALFNNLRENSKWRFDFIALLVLSTAIATLGLIQNSTAVVIGAMLVAPLMSPLIGSGLALLQGNMSLMLTATRAIILAFLSAIGIGYLLGLILPISELTPELIARGGPTLIDMAIGFLSGMAAAYCLARPELSAALPGVAIAAALVPPISTTGVSLALMDFSNAFGSALLFATNVVAVILGSSFSFFAIGVRSSGKGSRAPLWVRRTITALIITALVFSIPLGLSMISDIESPAIQSQDDFRLLKGNIAQLLKENGGTLLTLKPEREMLLIELEASRVPDQKLTQELSTLITTQLKVPKKIRIRTNLVIEIPPASLHPPKS